MNVFPVTVLNYLVSVNKQGRHVAHCLNFDLVATASDAKAAERRLDMLVRYHLASFMITNGASGIDGAAPKEFWDRYSDALHNGRVLPATTLKIELPPMTPIRMQDGEFEVVMAEAA